MSSGGWAQRQRAEQLVGLARYAEARDLLLPLIADEPHDADLLRPLARCYLGLSDTGQALSTALSAVDAEPTDAEGHVLLSAAYIAFDLQPQAIAAAEQAVELQPDAWQTWLCFARALAGDPDQLTDAWLAAMAAVQRGPQVAVVHRTVGDVAARLGWFAKARVAYEQSLALDPSDPVALANLARLQLDQDDAGAATIGFLAAMRTPETTDPDRSTAAEGLLVVGRAFLVRLCVMALLGMFVIGWSFYTELPLVLSAWPGVLRLVTGAAVVAIILGVNLTPWRETPAEVRAAWRRALRLTWLLTLVSLAGVLAGAFLPVLPAVVGICAGAVAAVTGVLTVRLAGSGR